MLAKSPKSARKPDISVVITAHREGPIAGPTIRSALAAAQEAEDELALAIEFIVVLDRADLTTRIIFEKALGGIATFAETDLGDPGQARNHAVSLAEGEVVAFLDGDDLWSKNWLTEGWRFCEERPDAIGHCDCIVAFGEVHGLWWHIDSESGFYDPDYLLWANYWDAMAIAKTELYRKYPFHPNDLKRGFGHEDWHWNCLTIRDGIPHKPVPRTIHFKRRRVGSQMSLVEKSDSTVWPLNLTGLSKENRLEKCI